MHIVLLVLPASAVFFFFVLNKEDHAHSAESDQLQCRPPLQVWHARRLEEPGGASAERSQKYYKICVCG
jgi:hypothetical protein